jgi:sulfite exporter TauE/SafE
MQFSLALTALLMGLVGGPHCVAMCGAACAGLGQAAGSRKHTAIFTFQIGRLIGYSLLGAFAAASMQGLGWLTIQSAALRPLWSMFHVASMVVGLVLVWQARQPLWVASVGRIIWAKARQAGGAALNASWVTAVGAPLLLGSLWALLPCGLLYSAVLLAAMAGGIYQGAIVMALFAVGTSASMVLAPVVWFRLQGSVIGNGGWADRFRAGDWGVRLAGAALAVSSGWALWMGLVQNAAPWCVNP